MSSGDRDNMQGDMIQWVEEIVALGVRRPGSPGDLATERYLEQKMGEFGLSEIRREPVTVNHWSPKKTILALPAAGIEVPCFAVPYTAWTESDGIRAASVYLGNGSMADFEAADLRGKIAVVDIRFGEFSAGVLKAGSQFTYDPAQTIPDGPLHCATWLIQNFAAYYEAERRGAVALIGLLRDSPIDGPEQYVPYDGYLKGLPAAWVGRECAELVAQGAQRHDEFLFSSDGVTNDVESHNIVGMVPGTTDESILLTCHHDGPFASAVEDASGLSIILWLARKFGAQPQRLRRNLVFVASSGHFHGGIGNRVFVKKHRDGLLKKTVAAFGIEHIAEEAEPDGQGGYRLTGKPEVRVMFVDQSRCLIDLLQREIPKWELDRTMAVDAYLFGSEPPCDAAPFFTAGIPSVCHISGPLYLFDPHDTVDKVRASDLPRVAGVFENLVEAVDQKDVVELERGLTRRRDDPPSPPPVWFLPPSDYPRPK